MEEELYLPLETGPDLPPGVLTSQVLEFQLSEELRALAKQASEMAKWVGGRTHDPWDVESVAQAWVDVRQMRKNLSELELVVEEPVAARYPAEQPDAATDENGVPN
jgi:hypothetical protein